MCLEKWPRAVLNLQNNIKHTLQEEITQKCANFIDAKNQYYKFKHFEEVYAYHRNCINYSIESYFAKYQKTVKIMFTHSPISAKTLPPCTHWEMKRVKAKIQTNWCHKKKKKQNTLAPTYTRQATV